MSDNAIFKGLHYLKFSLFHFLALLGIASIALGNIWIVYGFVVVSGIIVFGDLLLGSDTSEPEFEHPRLLNLQLYMALPLLLLLMFVSLWAVSGRDLMGFGATMTTLFEYDFIAAREQTQLWHYVVLVLFTGLLVSTIGTVTAHELVHRTWDRMALIIGRWLLAFSFDANFSIEHVLGHHRYVATDKDPATAPRGRNVYAHILISTFKGNISAWNIEAARLKRRSYALLSFRNTCLRGYMMSVALLAASYLIAGSAGLAFFTASAVWAKCMLEIVNYVEHYGIQRVPGKRVEPRHSWNTNCTVSSWALFNLTRHSHHHAHGQSPYYKLTPYPEAPTMLSGYLTCVFVALIPPLWFYMMKPRLAHWDETYATEQELAMINADNPPDDADSVALNN